MEPWFGDERMAEGFRLVCTCPALPEQYDVFSGDLKVGYVRLRHGWFRVDYPECGAETVFEYQFDDEWKGNFDDEDERMSYLTQGMQRLAERARPASSQEGE